MKLEIEIREGDALSFLRVISDHAPNAATRAMADRIHRALEGVLAEKPTRSQSVLLLCANPGIGGNFCVGYRSSTR